MVIIAATIGGSDDLGWHVLASLRKADFGMSAVSGLVIVLMAILMDRLTTAYARRAGASSEPIFGSYRKFGIPLGIAASFLLAWAIPDLAVFPREWTLSPSNAINDALNHFIAHYGFITDWIKTTTLYYVLLPARVGLVGAVTAYTWGFEFGTVARIAYWAVGLLVAVSVYRRLGRNAAVAFTLFVIVLYYGMIGIPWPAFFAVIAYLSYQSGGIRLAIFSLASMLFILLNGQWSKAMMSLYLCGTAVMFCFFVGGAIGIWAAQNDRVSAVLRPICNTLQTLPQFVLLIPALMLFQVGEFTALIAIVLYAIVPPIIYVEHAVRHVPFNLIEAATQLGVSRYQMLFDVKLPAAWNGIMLGLNQTIMFGLAMLVVTALVGTQDLGQQVYLGLSNADAGLGLIAGISIALIAMTADRIIRASISTARTAA
jgi:glycine betaine/proline transport system permease protein